MAHLDDATIIEQTHNTARYFTEQRQVAWVALIGTVLWGVIGYFSMPQRKDPDIPAGVALVICSWPGHGRRAGGGASDPADRRGRRRERQRRNGPFHHPHRDHLRLRRAQGSGQGHRRRSSTTSRSSWRPLPICPDGAGPIQFIKDFGDTAALMLTVASPRRRRGAGLAPRRPGAGRHRAAAGRRRARRRAALVYNFPPSISAASGRPVPRPLPRTGGARRRVPRRAPARGAQFVGVDGVTDLDDARLIAHIQRFVTERLRVSEFHPDAWPVVVVRDPAETRARLLAVSGDKYSYRELERFTDAHEADLPDGEAGEQGRSFGTPGRAGHAQLLPGADRLLRRADGQAARHPAGPEHRPERRPHRSERPDRRAQSERRVPQRARDRRRHRRKLEGRRAALPARPGGHRPGIPEPAPFSELLQLGGLGRPLAPEPRHHHGAPDAAGRKDRCVRHRGGLDHRSAAGTAAAGPDLCPHLGSAAPGRGEHRASS